MSSTLLRGFGALQTLFGNTATIALLDCGGPFQVHRYCHYCNRKIDACASGPTHAWGTKVFVDRIYKGHRCGGDLG